MSDCLASSLWGKPAIVKPAKLSWLVLFRRAMPQETTIPGTKFKRAI